MSKGLFITGTDTDIGKTYVTALIVKTEMGCIFIWTPSADRSKMLSGKVRNKYEQ